MAIALGSTARISRCFLLVSLRFLSISFNLYFSINANGTLFSEGLSDIPGEAMVKLYCPKCMDVYTPKSSRHHHTDGAYFGTGFPHMLFMVHPEYRPKRPANQFVPRFELHYLLSFTLVIPFVCISAVLPDSQIAVEQLTVFW